MPNVFKLEYNDIIIMKGSIRHPPLFSLALVYLKFKIFVHINNSAGGIPVQLWLTLLVQVEAFGIIKNKLNPKLLILAACQMTQK